MPVNITSPPVQIQPPTPLGDHVNVDSSLQVTNGPLDVVIEYEVQDHHVALGFSVVRGGSRTLRLLATGNHTLRNWFELQGPANILNVVDCRIRASTVGQPPRIRGFAVQI